MVNSRALEANPEVCNSFIQTADYNKTLLELCKQIAQIDPKVTFEAIVGKELAEKGLNLIYSVGRGAITKSCLVVMKYEGMC